MAGGIALVVLLGMLGGGGAAASAATGGALKPLKGKAGCIVSEFVRGPKPCAKGRGLDDIRGMALDPGGHGVYTVSFPSGISHVVRGRGGKLSVPAGPAGCVVEQDVASHQGCTVVPTLDDPEGLAFTPNGTQLYVGANNSRGVFGFSRDSAGGLTPIPPPGGCAAQPTSGAPSLCTPVAALGSAFGVAISADGQFVYVTGKDAVVGFARDAASGNLTPLPPVTGCVQEAPAPDGCAPGRGLAGPDSLALSADGRFLYAEADNGVAVLARDPATGMISQPGGPEGCVQASGADGCAQARTGSSAFGTHGVILSPDDRNLYEAFDAGVAIFSRDPATGALTQLPGTKGCSNLRGKLGCAPARGTTQATSLAISADGHSVYLAGFNLGTSGLLAFSRSPTDGSLTQLPQRAGCYVEGTSNARSQRCTQVHVAADTAVAVSGDGRTVYGASGDRSGVGVYARTP
jgi:DNA-binding beta-propeller fold protein YncE